jgi:hypothetical protein
MNFVQGNRYFYAREGKQVSFVRWDKSGLAVVVDDSGEQYHIREEDLSPLAEQVDVNIGEDIT